jgi:hypothetical protein
MLNIKRQDIIGNQRKLTRWLIVVKLHFTFYFKYNIVNFNSSTAASENTIKSLL